MKKLFTYGLLGVLAVGFFGSFMFAPHALAQVGDPLGLSYGAQTGLGQKDIRLTIANIIKVALSLIGILTVIIMIWAGFEWMTAGGSEEKVTTAKKRIAQAVIGLAIVLSAYSLTNFVITNLFEATTGQAYQSGEQIK